MHELHATPADGVADALRAVSARALDKAVAVCRRCGSGAAGVGRGAQRAGGPGGSGERRRGCLARRGPGGQAVSPPCCSARSAGTSPGIPRARWWSWVRTPWPSTARSRWGSVIRGHRRRAGVRIRGSGAARCGTGRRPRLDWYPSAAHPPAPGALPTDPDRISAEAASGLAAALKGWSEKYPGVRARQDVTHGHPAPILASYSGRANLVVLGQHGHPDGPGLGIGSVQHAVLDHVHGPSRSSRRVNDLADR